MQRRPRLGILVAWFVGFWVAGVRPALAAVLGAWSVVAALSERPALGLEWVLYGAVLTAMFVLLAIETYL